MANSKDCTGQHHIFVAEVVAVPAEGKIVVVTVCTDCDSVSFHEKVVAAPNSSLKMLKDKGEN